MFKDRTPRRRPETTTQRHHRGFNRTIRWRWLLALLPIVLVAGGTYYVLQSPLLTVQEVSVRGTTNLDRLALAEISGLEGKSMLRLPAAEARRRLLAIPAVQEVTITRELPSTVVIEIQERLPEAYWSVDGHDYVIDREGVVLDGGAPEGPAPRIVDVTPGTTLAPGDRVHPDAIVFAQRIMLESPRFLEENVYELEYRSGIGVTVIFDRGLRVTFGDERSYEYKIAVLSQLLEDLSRQGVYPQSVDLRFGERVTYE